MLHLNGCSPHGEPRTSGVELNPSIPYVLAPVAGQNTGYWILTNSTSLIATSGLCADG